MGLPFKGCLRGNPIKTLNLLIKPASSLCNIACTYCFYLDTAAHRKCFSYGMMTEDTAEMLIKKAFAFADTSVHFGFQGGEPALRGLEFYQRFHRLVEQHNGQKLPLSFSMQSNAMLFNDAWAEFFKKHQYLVGVSLDGTKETHDSYRVYQNQRGTFEEVMRGIGYLEQHGVDFNIITVVSNLVAQRGEEVYRFLTGRNFKYLQFIPCLELEKEPQDFLLSSEGYEHFLLSVFPLYKNDILNNNYTSVRYFDNLVGAFMGRRFESCDMQGRCSVNTVIEADGRVYPCDFYVKDEFCIGSVMENSFEEILTHPRGKEFCLPSFEFAPRCKNCPYAPLCRGGGCRRYRIRGSLEHRFCSAYLAFFGKHYGDLAQIASYVKPEN